MQLIELIVYPYTINYRVKAAYLCAFIVAVRINCINCMRFWILTSVIMTADSQPSLFALLMLFQILLPKGGDCNQDYPFSKSRKYGIYIESPTFYSEFSTIPYIQFFRPNQVGINDYLFFLLTRNTVITAFSAFK